MRAKITPPALTPLAQSLPSSVPFVGPEAQERARQAPFQARIGANENGFGPSPKVIDALARNGSLIWQYADPESFDLKAALARHHQIDTENLVLGEGIDGLLGYLVRLLCAPGDQVVTSLGAYPTFNYHATGFGAQITSVPYRDDHEDPEALIEAAKATGAKLIYFANPDNPMGTWLGAEKVQAMIEAVPDGTVLLLDEAYIETAPPGTAPPFDTDDPRVIRMRTFSKAYGMAGARVGYAIGHKALIGAFDKIRNHFGVAKLSQIAAQAALEDQDYLQAVTGQIHRACARIAAIARDNRLEALPTATNFVAIDCGRDGDFARAVLSGLLEQGIFVRMPFVAPQDRCIRISAGTKADLDALEAALPIALAQANART